MDGEAWWAAVHGAAQSRTGLKRLSSSSSSSSASVLKLSQISRKCSNIVIEKNLHVGRFMQLKPVLFKSTVL